MTAIVERLSVSPRVERIGNAELWLGDARDVLSGIRNADVIVTDPPYGIGYKTKHRKVASTPAEIANDKEPPLWSIRMCADAIADGGRSTCAPASLSCRCGRHLLPLPVSCAKPRWSGIRGTPQQAT